MALDRPRANSLSVSTSRARLRQTQDLPTPRRATYPLFMNRDVPPIPSLSFCDPKTPLPLPMSSSATSSTRSSLTHGPSSPRVSLKIPLMTPSSWDLQPKQFEASLRQRAGMIPPRNPDLLLPPASLQSTSSPCSSSSPASPCWPCFPYSPTTPTSPINPFLSPPLPRLAANLFFRHASPLLPASPLSIFDRAISPSSPTFLQSRTPSAGTPSWKTPPVHHSTTQTLGRREAWAGLSPTFLWPRTPPSAPLRRPADKGSLSITGGRRGDYEQGERSSVVSAIVDVGNVKAADRVHVDRRKMQIDFSHFLAAERVAAMDQASATPLLVPSKKHSAREKWRRLLPRLKTKQAEPLAGKSGRFGVWKGFFF